MKQRAAWEYVRVWRRLPPQSRQMVLAFVAGGPLAAIVWRLLGW
jgi:hypothetical protein